MASSTSSIPTWRPQQHGYLGKDMGFSSQPLNFIYQIFYTSAQGVLPSRTLTYNLSHLSKKEKNKSAWEKDIIYMIYIYKYNII